jgi:hypothetical protein
MYRFVMFLMLFFVVAFGQAPFNSRVVWEDSVRVDSTASYRLPMFWQDNGGIRTLVIEARNDSTAGFASDSAAVRIEYRQNFPLSKSLPNSGNFPYILSLRSRAHPDSLSSLWRGGSSFLLWDSLAIQSMDSAAVYSRNRVLRAGTTKYSYGDSLKTLQTSGFGAFTYLSFLPDYSPGGNLVVTGKANNGKRGVGSVWKFRLYQQIGTSVKVE